MYEAARLTDPIVHTQQLTGFLIGAVIGGAILIGAGAFTVATCGLGSGILVGLLSFGAAELARELGAATGSLVTEATGHIAHGSHNVFINGLAAAYVTCDVDCDEHPPVDGFDELDQAIKLGKKIAQGSSNVFINGYPAARVGDHTDCDSQISQGSRNVFIGGGRKTYLPIDKEVPAHYRQIVDTSFSLAGLVGGLARIAAGATVKAALPCAARFSAGYSAGELFGRYVATPTLQRIAGGLIGHPVEITTGRKLLLAEDETDFVIPGPVPYALQRFYASNLREAGALGRGWILPWEITLIRREGKIWYRDRQGRVSGFPEIAPGTKVYHQSEQLFLACTAEGRYLIHDLNDSSHDFGISLSEDQDIAYLQAYGDGQGHWLRFHWQGPRCVAIDLPADRLTFAYHQDRLTHIVREVGKQRQTLVSYTYTNDGQLHEVMDCNGDIVRRFRYDQHRMVSQQNALGFECRYRWSDDRVIEAQTSMGQAWTFVYGPDYTQVTDDLGRTTYWQFDQHHQIQRCTDQDGSHYRLDYDHAGRPIALSLPGDRTISVAYDNLGRPIAVTDPLGRITQTDYHDQSLRITKIRTPDQRTWQARYDEHGRLLSTTDPLGREQSYDYPPYSPWPSVHTDARGGQQHWEWNTRGQCTRATDCSQKTTRYDYDAFGQLSAITDALDQTTVLEQRPSGEPIRVRHPDHSEETYRYDAAGFLIAYTDAADRTQHWLRNAKGEVLEVRDAEQRSLHYDYDTHGRLLRLARGPASYRFAYDAGDRLIREIRPDGIKRRFRYTADGELSELNWQRAEQENRHSFRYDDTGKLLEQRCATATTTYTYDKGDRLTLVQRTPTVTGEALGITANTVSFRYDKAGRLLCEEGSNGQISYHYGPLDEIEALELPQHQRLEWLHYGSGHVHQIRCAEQTVTDIERDDLHREVLRSQGRLTHKQAYDPRGRKLWQSAGTAANYLGPERGLHWRSYRYTRGGELAEQKDRIRGPLYYFYDRSGQLLERSGQRCPSERFVWDAAGNLLAGDQQDGAVHGNRLKVWRDLRFTYDAFGNLTTKRSGAHRQQSFTYDAEHRLLSVVTQDRGCRSETRFDYDALGRRIAVHESLPESADNAPRWRTKRFLWQGLRLIQETNDFGTQQYLYSPDDPYTPLARIDTPQPDKRVTTSTRCYHFHTDAIGTPLELTDEQGDLAWAGNYQAWGKLVGQGYRAPGIDQPLRYAGQYADNSTGLHYNTFRYYDPDIGRFINQDPIGLLGGDNLYAYAPNPTGWVDPWGLSGIPKLPLGTIASFGDTNIVHYYHDLSLEHADPIHFHVEENGRSIGKIKADGKIISGKLSRKAEGLIKERTTIRSLRRAEKRIANYIRKVGGSRVGNRPFRPGNRGPKGGC